MKKSLIAERVRNFLKRNVWLVFMTVCVDLVAIGWWYSFLTTGRIRDERHGLMFAGVSASGHLIAISAMAVVLTYFLGRSIRQAMSRQDADANSE